MSYTEKLTETQSENLDVRIFEIFSKFGIRSPHTGSYEWTFDNHQVFKMARALLDAEAERIVKTVGIERMNPAAVVVPVVGAGSLDLQGLPGVILPVEEQRPPETDAADPHSEYKGPNLTFDRLNTMRLFAEKKSREGAKVLSINLETLLCLVDTVQHHEYVPRDAWQTGTPPTLNNDYDFYNVAVRRCHDPESVWVFPAAYANNYDGELQDQDGIDFIANGWFDVGPDRDADPLFVPTLEKGDEVVGWQPMPKYHT